MKVKNILILALFLAFQAKAQISQLQIKQIDSVFLEWNVPNHPGGAIGIMQNGKTIFSKAYGLASLEYLVPNTTGTIFNTGSVSKQFTAMGIVILEEQGKLSFDDDIRKYLPELPEFEYPVTIRHMLHHTSGLRSLHAMLELAGWRGDDSRTNEDLNRFMMKQKDLNFRPGDQYLYCNTGYMLMVNIIEKITNEKFPKWMKDSVFEPLGMGNTYVEDNYARVVPNNATSYDIVQDDKFDRAVEYWGYVGSGNMHSTTDDLLKWQKNFYEPKAGWESRFKTMQTTDPFNDGTANNYAFGVVVDNFDSYSRVGHSGAIGGFRASISTLPEEKLSVAILTNFSNSSPSAKANQVARILLAKADLAVHIPEQMHTPTKILMLSNDQLIKYQGDFWNDQENYARKIQLRNDTLRYVRSTNNENPIVPVGNDEFQMVGASEELKVKFEFKGESVSMIVTGEDGKPSTFVSFKSDLPPEKEMNSYTGKFYSDELETTYEIYLESGSLFYHHSRHGDHKMKILKKDVLEADWPLVISKFKRNEKNEVTGILVSNGRVVNLWFEKLK